MGFNFTILFSIAFLGFMANNIYNLYLLFTPETCSQTDVDSNCISPFIATDAQGIFPLVQLRVYLSSRHDNLGSLATTFENFQMADSFQKELDVTLPTSAMKNESLYVHCILLPHEFKSHNAMSAPWHVHDVASLVVYQEPAPRTFQLLDEKRDEKSAALKPSKNEGKVVSHLRSVLPIRIAIDNKRFKANEVSPELRSHIYLAPGKKGQGSNYLPLMFIDEMSMRSKDLVEITQQTTTMKINYEPISVAKLLLLSTISKSTQLLLEHGFKDKDVDEMRGLFTETSLYLILVTFIVSSLHLLFDILAFKNDISFWKGRKSMVGISSKTLLWRCFSQTIIFFYLWDQETSMLVLAPAGVSTLIEYWKVTIAYKVTFTKSGLRIGSQTAEESETDSFDAQAMKYLAWLLVPLCIGGAIYSLAYVPHKSWRSWAIQSAANGVYAFGFLFMLPQLFVNYKLKSVAHLPWRAFMYKAFNTFIDDLFAFIITMPAAHRVACFRDDIVFVIYLYQRYLYPVDYSRVNEFGEAGTVNAEDKKEEEIAVDKGAEESVGSSVDEKKSDRPVKRKPLKAE